MLKNHWRLISRLERFGDNFIVILAFFLSYRYRDLLLGGLGIPELQVLAPIEEYFFVLACALPLFNAVLSLVGAYRSMRFSSYLRLLRMAVLSGLVVFVALGFLLYLMKLDLSRSLVGLFCALSALLLYGERVLVLSLLRLFRAGGRNFRNLLIFGTGPQARQMYLEIARQPELGAKVVGFVSPTLLGEGVDRASNTYASNTYDLAARVLADAKTFEAALKRHAVDEVLFTDIELNFAQVRELAQIAVEEGVRVTLAADFFSLDILKSEISFFGATPLIHYHSSPTTETSAALLFKRFIDFVVAVLALLLLSPLLLLTALCIKLDSAGPVFFRQRRVGLNGRTFILLKFRSMVEGAESMLPQLKSQNEMDGPVFKIRNDPRITRVGKFLRRFSIDELPQLWNVVRGDMSLVGPRPPLPSEVPFYLRKQRRRLSMRPGLTCIWQVSGRNEIPDFDEWARLDLHYIDNWSLWVDLKLLLRTIPAVLGGFGAR